MNNEISINEISINNNILNEEKKDFIYCWSRYTYNFTGINNCSICKSSEKSVFYFTHEIIYNSNGKTIECCNSCMKHIILIYPKLNEEYEKEKFSLKTICKKCFISLFDFQNSLKGESITYNELEEEIYNLENDIIKIDSNIESIVVSKKLPSYRNSKNPNKL